MHSRTHGCPEVAGRPPRPRVQALGRLRIQPRSKAWEIPMVRAQGITTEAKRNHRQSDPGSFCLPSS